MSSMPQHAVAKGIGHSELRRDQFRVTPEELAAQLASGSFLARLSTRHFGSGSFLAWLSTRHYSAGSSHAFCAAIELLIPFT